MFSVVALLLSPVSLASASLSPSPEPPAVVEPAPIVEPRAVAERAPVVAPPAGDRYPSRSLHFGLELRADFWRHPLRTPIGVSSGAFDLTLITDPGVIIDKKSDVDLIAGWWFLPHAWGLSLGWRNSSTPIADGRRFSEAVLLGIDAAMPRVSGPRLRATFGLQVATELVRHGAGVPVRTITLAPADLSDFVTVSFNVRFEFAAGF